MYRQSLFDLRTWSCILNVTGGGVCEELEQKGELVDNSRESDQDRPKELLTQGAGV